MKVLCWNSHLGSVPGKRRSSFLAANLELSQFTEILVPSAVRGERAQKAFYARAPVRRPSRERSAAGNVDPEASQVEQGLNNQAVGGGEGQRMGRRNNHSFGWSVRKDHNEGQLEERSSRRLPAAAPSSPGGHGWTLVRWRTVAETRCRF